MCATAALCLGILPAHAQSLIQGPAETVTSDDLLAAAQRVPSASRSALLSRVDSVRRQAEDIYLRRVLASEAERAGLDKKPVVAALLRQARERILSEAQLVEIDLAALPSEQTTVKYAADLYRADPSRYQTPEQTRARHILVSKSDPIKGREKADGLLAQVKSGASFDALAREHSADLATAKQGGDLGWFTSSTMVKEFQDALAGLKLPGELSPVFETQFGFHIVRLDDRRNAGLRTFDEVQGEIAQEVRAKAQADARRAKIRELMAESNADQAAIEAFAKSFAKP